MSGDATQLAQNIIDQTYNQILACQGVHTKINVPS